MIIMMKENKMKVFKNFTPHSINLNDGREFPSEGIARVAASFSQPDEDGCMSQIFGDIIGLPEFKEGVLLIVSSLVLSAAKESGRTDCVAPASGHPDTVRNDLGYIVSVPGFVK
jgi:hypothetical protein